MLRFCSRKYGFEQVDKRALKVEASITFKIRVFASV